MYEMCRNSSVLKGIMLIVIFIYCLCITVDVSADSNQFYTKSLGKTGHIVKVMNDGSVQKTFYEGHLVVKDPADYDTVYCLMMNEKFTPGYKTRQDARLSMSNDEVEKVALSLEYINSQYAAAHPELSFNQIYLLGQCTVWRQLSELRGWQTDNIRVDFSDIPEAIQSEAYSGAKAFINANKGKYKCGGYVYTAGKGQDVGRFWAEKRKETIIRTTSTDKETGAKKIVSAKSIKIVDKVELSGLEVGTKYKLTGWQMIKEENAELLIDGKKVSSDYEFTADNENMTVEVPYSFNGSELGGKNIVTFEELYDVSDPKQPVKVAEHKDINDDGQTVRITERVIKIHTTASDKNGKKEIEEGKDLTIVDKVTLDGLEVGTKYKLTGWQMIKEENAELLIDGKKVSGDYEFTADNKKMTVEILFTFDGSALGGKKLVTFEELYDMTKPDEAKKVAEHKDITDEGQTVTITKHPSVTKTGDSSNMLVWVIIAVISFASIFSLVISRLRKYKNQ